MSDSFLSLAALPAPEVSVREEGSAVAGSNYSLFCDVTIPQFSDTINVSVPFISWVSPSGMSQQGYLKYISLSPLTLDDEGTYTCTAHYFVNGVSSPSASTLYNVIVSKSYSSCML